MKLLNRTTLLQRSGRGRPIRVGVIAGTALDRAGLLGIVREARGLLAIDLGDGGPSSRDLAVQFTPPVIIIALDRDATRSFAAALSQRELGIQVLALVRMGGVEDVLALARAGVTGFLYPETGAQGLLRAIRRLAVTGCAVPKALVAPLLDFVNARATGWQTPGGVVLQLTSREAQIVRCLALGLNDREMARTLHIQEGTVKAHIHRLLRRLGVPRRPNAVERVREMDHKISLLAATRRAISGEGADWRIGGGE